MRFPESDPDHEPNPSLWADELASTPAPALDHDIEVDVAIVGAGITGVTTALRLAEAGKRVALLDSARAGHGTTGSTTAHLTEAIDARYMHLERDFGNAGAALVARASRAAIREIELLASQHAIGCDFRRLPGYFYSEDERDLELLHREYEAARRAGVAVEMTRAVPLPFRVAAAVMFPHQAEVHIGRYLSALVRRLRVLGVQIFEGTRVTSVEQNGSPIGVRTEHAFVKARYVVVATNNPLSLFFLQTKVASYRSYAIAARPPGVSLSGLFWDTADPYHYLRSTRAHDGGGDYLIVGGEDRKTGTDESTEDRYRALTEYVTARFGVADFTHRWSAQVLEPVDGLPYIGRSPSSDRVFYATGYSGNGITFGTLAAMMIRDAILGRPNDFADLFDAKRIHLAASAKDFVSENAGVPAHLVGDRLRPAEAKRVEDVRAGEGKIVRVQGKKCAVYRHDDGHLSVLSPVCPHLGCHVHFNDAEKTWDCPCHGSRFDVDGVVKDGPATSNLSPVEPSIEDRPARDSVA